jgi:hypothetical protein
MTDDEVVLAARTHGFALLNYEHDGETVWAWNGNEVPDTWWPTRALAVAFMRDQLDRLPAISIHVSPDPHPVAGSRSWNRLARVHLEAAELHEAAAALYEDQGDIERVARARERAAFHAELAERAHRTERP